MNIHFQILYKTFTVENNFLFFLAAQFSSFISFQLRTDKKILLLILENNKIKFVKK